MTDFNRQRKSMVDSQLRPNGITDHRILAAMGNTPRESFVPESCRIFAYSDKNIPLTGRLASSRSLMCAMVFSRLVQHGEIRPDSTVLVIGAGAGYGCAVIAEMAQSVIGIEEDAELLAQAPILASNIKLIQGNHREGYRAGRPYDVILIEGRAEEIPEALYGQLLDEGRIVTVLGTAARPRISVCTYSEGAPACVAYEYAEVGLVPGFARKVASFAF